MITLFVNNKNNKPIDFSISNLIQMRVNMDCKLVKNNNGIYLTYNVSNIEKIMKIINEPDDLPVDCKFDYIKQGSLYCIIAT